SAAAVRLWGKIRRHEVPIETTVFLERLQTRKAKVSEGMEKQKAAKRFEAGAGAPAAPLPDVLARPAATPVKPAPVKKPAPEQEEDFATRLMRAKKKAMEERDKPK